MQVCRARAALVFLLLASGLCSGRSNKLSSDLETTTDSGNVDVIVQFAERPSNQQHGNIERRGGKLKAELDVISSAVYSVPASALEDLASDPDVLYITPDRPVQAMLDYANATTGALLAAGSSLNGTGIGIAIIDSGIIENRDLLGASSSALNTSRVVYSQNFVPGLTNASDLYGHGTHVAGIAAANGNASTGSGYVKTFRGIAPNASLINLRVLDGKGAGTDSTVIAAIDRAIQLKSVYNIRVMNISLGRPVYESYRRDPLCQAVERAWTAGIVVVVAAGNEGRNKSAGTDGYATITSPGNDPLVITVGAMKTMTTESRADDQLASYSSKGPTLIDHVVKPDLVAPGNRIVSLLASKSLAATSSTAVNQVFYSYYQSTSSKTYSADYYRLSGTSMASPMVSGAAALMLQKDWSLTPDTVKARLMRTASKTFPAYSTATDPVTKVSYTSQYDVFSIGAGYLDIYAALNDVEYVLPTSSAASPIAVRDQSTGAVRVVNADASIWGKVAVWGTATVWGTAAVWGTNVFIDGQSAVWGTAAVWGSSAVWGTAKTSGTAAVWGSTAVWGTKTTTAGEVMNQLINGES
jgi:serine protease AprX